MALRRTRTRGQVKDTTTLTTAYSGFKSDTVDLGTGLTVTGVFCGFLLDVSQGTATTMELKLEVGDDNADTDAEFYTLTKATGALDERVITLATLATPDTIAVFSDVNLSAFKKVRLRLKTTGGGADATVKAYAVFGGQS